MTSNGVGALAGGFAPDLRTSTVPFSARDFADVVQRSGPSSFGIPR